MKTNSFLLAALVAIPLVTIHAKDPVPDIVPEPSPATESADVKVWSSYVFDGDLDAPYSGSLRSLQTGFSALFPVSHIGPVRFSLGANYQRFDFGGTSGPMPSSAVNFSPTVTLEYLVRGQPAVTLTTQPGFQYAGDFDIASFDSPTILTVGMRFSDSLIVFIGGMYGRFREYPVLPIAGFIWTPSENFRVNLTGPQISEVYEFNDSFSVQLDGGITGGSYRISDGVYDGKNLDYMDIRAGAAAKWKPGKIWSLETGAGWSFIRRFGFDDGDEKIDAEGAPYVRIQASASF